MAVAVAVAVAGEAADHERLLTTRAVWVSGRCYLRPLLAAGVRPPLRREGRARSPAAGMAVGVSHCVAELLNPCEYASLSLLVT